MYVPLPTKGIILRPYQADIYKAVRKGQSACIVLHRRAGKDVLCCQLWLLLALQKVGTHIYLFPSQKQAREILWSGMMFNGKPFLSIIPEQLIQKRNEARMEITLINGSRLVLGGSNMYDSWMGSNPRSIIYSEYSLQNPLARQYLNPILIQNGGQEVLNYTPRGMGHGWEMLQVAKNNPKYYTKVLGVDKTLDNDGNRVITDAQIEEAKSMGMSQERIEQEFFVSFLSGNQGSYFTLEMQALTNEDRIRPLKPNRGLPLMLSADLGGVDSTCFILFQVMGKQILILKIIVSNGKAMKWYLDESEKYRQENQLEWGHQFMPHDVKQQAQGFYTAESRLTQARKAGWSFLVTPKFEIDDGIEAMRFALRHTVINSDCDLFVRALREYQREYDEATKMYAEKPLHNWASHMADAYRYLSINYTRLFNVPSPIVIYGTSL